jgi:cellulose synthase/poly-beta-1,6-N-acetylglucosamine synthase-like glycosyltransferase
MAFCLYQISVAISAFKRPRIKQEQVTENHRFAAIIAARNEEQVITSLIESIRLSDYPAELLDIIVIADNCDDNTAGVAEQAGAIVYTRYNSAEIGKGYVLKFIFDKLFKQPDRYDAFCILDADNLVDREFFTHMNRALSDGAKVAQGYRDMKNPYDNWISGNHSLFFWMENRFFDHARDMMGLSAIVNGTGYMISSAYIREFGFNMKTVTEDVEMTIQSVINGAKVDWVPQARFYDEQPLSYHQSMVQRSRWVSGIIQNMLAYYKAFTASIAKNPSWVKIDLFLFIFSLPIMILGAAAMILYFALSVFNIFDPVSTLINLLSLAGGAIAVFWGLGFLTVKLERKNIKGMTIAVLMSPLFNLTWLVIWCKCLFKHTGDWVPIEHGRNMSIKDIETTRQKQ